MEAKIVYFDRPGTANTEETLLIARRRAEELGIKKVIVSSTSGNTAVRAADVFKGMNVIAVSHSAGWKEPNTQEFTDENKRAFEAKSGTLLTTTHAFSSVSRAVRKQFNTYELGDIIASTLRVFGDGMKVVCEITMMAADAGLVRTDEDVIVIAGTSRGADTAVVLQPANSNDFFRLRVKELLCKPRF